MCDKVVCDKVVCVCQSCGQSCVCVCYNLYVMQERAAEEDEEEEDHARWCRSKNKNPTQILWGKNTLRSVFSTSHPNMTTSNKAKSIAAKPTTSVSVSLLRKL